MRAVHIVVGAMLLVACNAPVDPRSTEHGQVVHERCISCHDHEFSTAMDPPHHGELPTTCWVCHHQDEWAPARLEHRGFSLTAAHATVRCFDCHRRSSNEHTRFEGTPSECVGCHADDAARATETRPWHATE